MKLKLYTALVKNYIDGGPCPDNLGLENACGKGCNECRKQAIDKFIINTELFEILKNNYMNNCFGSCPSNLDIDFYQYENCSNNCRECRKKAMERIENNEC